MSVAHDARVDGDSQLFDLGKDPECMVAALNGWVSTTVNAQRVELGDAEVIKRQDGKLVTTKVDK